MSFAIAGANEGMYAQVLPVRVHDHSACDEGHARVLDGGLLGRRLDRLQQKLISNPPKTCKDLLKPEYKGKVAINGSPLTSSSAVAGVIAAAIGNGGSASNVAPGIDLFAQ